MRNARHTVQHRESPDGLTYLATPYSHPGKAVRQSRFEVVNAVAARLIGEGYLIYSPISHSHPIALAGQLPTGWDYWERYDRLILSVCSQLIVVCQNGWSESVGVKAEIDTAREIGLPVSFMRDH